MNEIAIELAHLLLGAGIRLFDNLGGSSIELINTGIVEGTSVTHMRLRVVK